MFGIAALLAVLATAIPAVVKGRSRAAYFALATFLVTCVALNPTQLGFVMAVVIGWVAYAVPRPAPSPAPPDGPQARPLGALRLAGASIVGLAFAATVTATVAYSSARAAIGAGDMQRAEEALELATILDPSLAFYSRQLGTVRLVSGDPGRAVPALARATALNPSDDLAWRVLGLAAEGSGDPSGGKDALERAVEVQRSDPTNLLLLASILREDADQLARTAALTEIVQALPAVVGAQRWKTFAAPDSTVTLVLMAQERWARGLPSFEPRALQPLLLGVWVGLPDDELHLEAARMSPSLRDAYVAVMRCDPNATATLRATSDADRRQPIYWALASRLARMQGRDAATFDRAYRLMTGLSLTGGGSSPLNPLNTNVGRGASPDLWGYRRQPIDWPDLGQNLPSPAGGFVRWVGDPSAAVREAGLEDILQNCPTE
jgi:tetratricopeptide (TPR) repeat protein